jgi:hypothetical protein
MMLSVGGVAVVEQIISDDARALRLPTPAALEGAPAFGHPSVDAALRSGRWVIDPSGAPPLVRAEEGPGQAVVDPFREALTAFGFVRQSVADAFEVREFNFEAIVYKPSQDPWGYPRRSRGEVRYDMARRFLPKTEDQIGGAQGDIIPGHFRKLSAYVLDGRVYQVCSLVDIEGHEDFIKLKELGEGKGNPFHRTLLNRIRKGDTQLPIFELEHYITMTYPERVEIGLPADAHVGLLDGFEQFQNESFADLLKPKGEERPDLKRCDRPADVEEPEA